MARLLRALCSMFFIIPSFKEITAKEYITLYIIGYTETLKLSFADSRNSMAEEKSFFTKRLNRK